MPNKKKSENSISIDPEVVEKLPFWIVELLKIKDSRRRKASKRK